MLSKDLILGIDTSNYKTSLAVTDSEGNILFNHQRFLDVKQGERGLRQSEAFFQHVQRIPDVLTEILSDSDIRDRICAVAVSTRPRPVEGSYMPVFTAGAGFAKTTAAALNVPLFEFSHQEGHIEAVQHYSELRNENHLICFHFSGGTTEAILCNHEAGEYRIVGGTKDLAYGQVLDRCGVALGLPFPCGEALDRIVSAPECPKPEKHILTPVKVKEGHVNLSGLETQVQRKIQEISESVLTKSGNTEGSELSQSESNKSENLTDNPEIQRLVYDLFSIMSESVYKMTMHLSEMHGIDKFIYAGGVSSSSFMRDYLSRRLPSDIKAVFGSPALSSDNAVGISLLGGAKVRR